MKKKVCIILISILSVLCLAFALSACANIDFKVSFVVDGETVRTINTNGDEIISMPPDPQKEGYIFDGWYWDKDVWEKPFTANSLLNEPLNADMRVYAKWRRDCEHNEVVDNGYAATCTEDGLTDGSHCSICNDVLVAQEVISATGHSIEQVTAQAPTCTEVGWNAYEYCTKCDYTTKIETEANGHDIRQAVAEAPTCTEAGWNAYEYCANCDYTEKTEIKATGHSLKQVVAKAPTCTESGYNAYEYCTKCDHTTKVGIDAIGHDVKQVTAKTPDCTDIGWNAYEYCSRCDYTTKVELPATGHHYGEQWENDATYHWHDADCGHSLTTEKVKHSFDDNWKCTVCDYQDIVLHGTELTSKAFRIDGTDLYTKVSNATETFSFINDIRVADGAIYTLHTDISCSGASELRAKTAPLQIGDNTLYILVSNGNDIELYTVEIRRRPIYTVSFNTLGGSEIESRQIEEDSLTSEPNTTRNGYIFDGWDYQFENAITEDTVISANWITIVRNIQYTLDLDIEHSNPLTYIYDDETIRLVEKSSDNAYFVSWYLNGEYVSTLDAHQLVDYNLVGYVGTAGLGITGSSVTSCSSTATEVNIPTKYKGNDINSIGQNAFKNCTKLKDITIPDSVTGIGSSAFYGCSGLTEITIPDSVTSLGSYAFYGCSGLTSVTIPDSVTSLGSYAFSRCSKLTSVTIPDSVTSIGNSAFDGCSGLATVNWNATACTSAGYTSYPIFNNCTSLTTVNIGDNVTTIPSDAFSGCSGLTSVTIPDSVTSIGSYAFSWCSKLTSVTIPDSVTSLGDSAFYKCSRLQAVYITNIAKWCEINLNNATASPLYYAQKLYLNGKLVAGDLIIPEGTTSLGNYAFYGCSGLTSITIPDSVTSIGSSAFNGCSKLTSITIPDGVTSIGSSAFNGCSKLTSITIPDSVTSIGTSILSGCAALESISVPFLGASRDASTNATSVFGYFFSTEYNYCSENYGMKFTMSTGYTWQGFEAKNSYNQILCYTISKSIRTVKITSAYVISDYAFFNCDLINKIVINKGVIRIGSCAFYGCSGLTSITIPDSVTSIGSSAFNECSGLTSVTIGNSVTSIGSSAFYRCSGLTSIAIPDSVTSIGSSAFVGTAWFNNQPDGIVYAGKVLYKYKGTMPANTKITIVEGTKAIASSAFSGCSRLTSVTIPDSVTSIGDYAFYGCSGLTEITIPDSVTSIGSSAFYNCSGLTSIKFDNTSGWYRTSSSTDCTNKTNGTYTSVTNTSNNVTYFTNTYKSLYWYRK